MLAITEGLESYHTVIAVITPTSGLRIKSQEEENLKTNYFNLYLAYTHKIMPNALVIQQDLSSSYKLKHQNVFNDKKLK